MTAKIILVVLGLSFFLNNTLADSYIPCKIGDETAFWLKHKGVWGEKINDTHGQGLITVLNTTGIKEFKVINTKWLTLTFDKNAQTITVFATEAFNTNYDQNGAGSKLQVDMTVTCEDDGELFDIPYFQEVVDFNTYAPKWNQPNYLFEIHGSLKQDINLTNFIEISASDIDFTDVLSFDIEHKSDKDDKDNLDDFKLIIERIEGKTTIVQLYALRDILPPYNETYVMRVKDRDTEDAKITTADLTIHLIESEIPLKFAQSTYTYHLINDTLFSDDVIQLSEGLDHSTELSIEDSAYSQFFSIELDYLTGHIQLVLIETLPLPQQKTSTSNPDIFLKLKAKWQNKESFADVKIHSEKDVALVCYVPGMDITSKTFYNPQKIKDTTNVSEIVFNITGTKNVENMTCGDNDYLRCEFEKTQGEFKIFTKEKFANYEDFEKNTTISMNLQIKCPANDMRNLIFQQDIHDTNNHKPTFSKDEYYFAFYNDLTSSFENTFDITTMQEIRVSDADLTSSACIFRIEDDDDLFKVIYYSTPIENRECYANIAPKGDVKAPLDITFSLIVEDDGIPMQSSRTKIRVHLVKVHANDGVLEFFFAYITVSLVGMILMFVVTMVAISAMICLIFRRFLVSKPRPQPMSIAMPNGRLPEKLPL